MERVNVTDLNMHGVGSASGGHYRNVTIEGVSRIDGDLSCERFTLNGVGTVKGSVRSSELFDLNGKMTAFGEIEAPALTVNGHLTLHGRMRGDDVKLNGFAEVHGGCDAERFYSEGGLTVGGLLNAGSVDIFLQGRTQVGEIGGERITVQKSRRKDWSRLLKWVVPRFQPGLRTSAIEGDEIELQLTTAGIVRGNRVVIGPGCKIGRVEYAEELIVHPDSRVGERLKL
jgi:cytoskeletal protein CcmA (bactofilin family)